MQEVANLAVLDTTASRALGVLQAFFGDAYLREFAVSLWDGTFVGARGTERFVFCVNGPGALRTALKPPFDLAAGRAFVSGIVDIRGDLEYAFETISRAVDSLTLPRKLRLAAGLRQLPAAPMPPLREALLHGHLHSQERDRAAIAFHYDQPMDFFASFLDPELLYSCAYFDEGIESLDAAQALKVKYVLRKVRLRPGDRLLDIGCGWGALVIEAARQGAHVVGVTLSRSQYEEGCRRIARAGLQGRARIELSDYRELRGLRFDKIVSVGMFEHVGRPKLRGYFKAALDVLEPGGLFLNHGIALAANRTNGGKSSGFMERFIFPDGELVSISDALVHAEAAGFEVRDVENLREHYARTLRAWVSNLARNRIVAERAAGPQSYRAWRLYMAGSAQGFRTGRLALFQSLLARRHADGRVDVPPTRRDLYRDW